MRDQYKIHHSMKILPHDQNTGGFFLALIKKIEPVVFSNKANTKHRLSDAQFHAVVEESQAISRAFVDAKSNDGNP